MLKCSIKPFLLSSLTASISSVDVSPNFEFIPPLFAQIPLPPLCKRMRRPIFGFGLKRFLAVSIIVSSSPRPSIVIVILCPISAAIKPRLISSLSLKPFTVIGEPSSLYAIARSSSALLPASKP